MQGHPAPPGCALMGSSSESLPSRYLTADWLLGQDIRTAQAVAPGHAIHREVAGGGEGKEGESHPPRPSPLLCSLQVIFLESLTTATDGFPPSAFPAFNEP